MKNQTQPTLPSAREFAHSEVERTIAERKANRDKATLANVKAGTVKLPPPIYKSKPYIVLSKEGVVLVAGSLEYLKEIVDYYDEFLVEVRQHDLDANDNTKIAPDKATAGPWKIYSSVSGRWIGAVDGGEIVAIMPDEIVENHPTAAQRRWANNAALIVRAANSFDALKSALEKCENVIGMARLQGKLSDNALSPVNNALISAHAALDAVRK